MHRPTADEYFIQMALLASTRGTCLRRRVGCVIVNKHNHVIATGYNGVARGSKHCLDHPCPGATAKSGEGLDACYAIHAEQNALLQCKNVEEIDTIYCTDSPCIQCVKLLQNTSCQKIKFLRAYPHSESEKIWKSDHLRLWIQVTLSENCLIRN